jgi:phasin family protein
MMTAEQVLTAQKANAEILFGLTAKAFEGVEKLVELNLQVAKTALTEAAETAQAALSVRDAQELLALQAGLLQPAAEKAAAYGRHVYDIAAQTNAEVTKVAETTIAEAQRGQECARRQRERGGAGQVGPVGREQRLRERAQGRQAGRRRGRGELHRHHQQRGQGRAEGRQARRLSQGWAGPRPAVKFC